MIDICVPILVYFCEFSKGTILNPFWLPKKIMKFFLSRLVGCPSAKIRWQQFAVGTVGEGPVHSDPKTGASPLNHISTHNICSDQSNRMRSWMVQSLRHFYMLSVRSWCHIWTIIVLRSVSVRLWKVILQRVTRKYPQTIPLILVQVFFCEGTWFTITWSIRGFTSFL